MTLNIDFEEKIVYMDEWPLEHIQVIRDMLEAANENPSEYAICSVMNTQFENDNTAGLDVNYQINKREVN